jgi:NitT/TauT family transport system substrate-binding protein
VDKKVILAIVIAAIVVVGVTSAALLLSMRDKGGDVSYLAMAPKDMKAALATDQVDAYIAWEPYVSDSVVGGVGEVLLWTEDIMPNHPCCVLVLSTEFLSGTDGLDLAKRFVKAHIEATEWMNGALADKESEDYTKLVDMAVGFTARNATVVEAAFEHLQFKVEMGSSFDAALEKFTQMYIDLNMTTSEKLDDRGYSSVEDFVDSYVNESFLEAADGVAPSATILNSGSPIKLGYLLGDLHQMAQVVAQNASATGTSKSFFETYGLEVEDAVGAPFANGGAEMDGFSAGTVDIGYLGAPPSILKHLNGGTGTLIVAQANVEGSGLVVAADSGIASLEDLVNKTVAVPGPPAETSIQFLLLKIELEDAGLELVVKT